MAKKAINDAPGLPKALGPYSRAVWAGNLLYVSGQTGTDPNTGKIATGGVGEETRQCIENLTAILQAAGLTRADVVKSNIYLTDINDFAAMNEVYAKHFDEPRPARTTVAVAALPGGARVEIEVVAVSAS